MAASDPVLRLFVGLRPTTAARDLLARAARRVGEAAPRARLVRPENLHLTLVFLGGTPASLVPALVASLEATAKDVAPFPWCIAGLGAFPDAHRPRVVWAGVDPAMGAVPITTLAGRVACAVARVREARTGAGDAREERDPPAGDPREASVASARRRDDAEPFHPHVTLARLDPPRPTPALENLLTAGTLQDTYKAEVASDLALMVSENDGSGVRYRTLATVPFGAVRHAAAGGSPIARDRSPPAGERR